MHEVWTVLARSAPHVDYAQIRAGAAQQPWATGFLLCLLGSGQHGNFYARATSKPIRQRPRVLADAATIRRIRR